MQKTLSKRTGVAGGNRHQESPTNIFNISNSNQASRKGSRSDPPAWDPGGCTLGHVTQTHLRGNVGAPGKVSPYFPPKFSHPNLGMTVIHPWGAVYGASICLFPFSTPQYVSSAQYRAVSCTRSTGDLVSFVLWVPGLNEGVMFGGKALGLMARTLVWMPGTRWACAGQTFPQGGREPSHSHHWATVSICGTRGATHRRRTTSTRRA